jgi:hypothetical protein
MFIIRYIIATIAIFVGSILIGWFFAAIAAIIKQSLKLVWSGLKFAFRKRTKEQEDVSMG